MYHEFKPRQLKPDGRDIIVLLMTNDPNSIVTYEAVEGFRYALKFKTSKAARQFAKLANIPAVPVSISQKELIVNGRHWAWEAIKLEEQK